MYLNEKTQKGQLRQPKSVTPLLRFMVKPFIPEGPHAKHLAKELSDNLVKGSGDRKAYFRQIISLVLEVNRCQHEGPRTWPLMSIMFFSFLL